MAKLAESRDPEIGAHLHRIRKYCQILGEELWKNSPSNNQIDEQFLEDIYRSSPLHDIGKVEIPERILLKPGSLTNKEFEIMKQHSIIGDEALRDTVEQTTSAGFLTMASDIARYHHERYGGSGYPDGLKKIEIPLSARIVALADVYDALTNIRVYKPAFNSEVAILMIEEERGRHFDPVIIEAFTNRHKDFLEVSQKVIDSAESPLPETIAG